MQVDADGMCESFAESNMRHAMNGYMYDNNLAISMNVSIDTSWSSHETCAIFTHVVFNYLQGRECMRCCLAAHVASNSMEHALYVITFACLHTERENGPGHVLRVNLRKITHVVPNYLHLFYREESE